MIAVLSASGMVGFVQFGHRIGGMPFGMVWCMPPIQQGARPTNRGTIPTITRSHRELLRTGRRSSLDEVFRKADDLTRAVRPRHASMSSLLARQGVAVRAASHADTRMFATCGMTYGNVARR
jgi:hypothetical protein